MSEPWTRAAGALLAAACTAPLWLFAMRNTDNGPPSGDCCGAGIGLAAPETGAALLASALVFGWLLAPVALRGGRRRVLSVGAAFAESYLVLSVFVAAPLSYLAWHLPVEQGLLMAVVLATYGTPVLVVLIPWFAGWAAVLRLLHGWVVTAPLRGHEQWADEQNELPRFRW